MPEAPQSEAVAQAAEASDETPGQARGSRFYYCLGLTTQTLLWFLLFLAIIIAVAVGNKLTEFRYVGF